MRILGFVLCEEQAVTAISNHTTAIIGKPLLWWRTIGQRNEVADEDGDDDDYDALPNNPAMYVGRRRAVRASVPIMIGTGKFVIILASEDPSGTWSRNYNFQAHHQDCTGPATTCQLGKVSPDAMFTKINRPDAMFTISRLCMG